MTMTKGVVVTGALIVSVYCLCIWIK